MNEIISKIGNVEQLELFAAEEFSDTPDDTLAEWINTGHSAIKMAVRRLAIHVAQVGAWLVAVRNRKQHGEWLPWLAENCSDISQRTAYNYIETYEELKGANLQLIANLTPIQAYRHIGIVKDPTDKLEVETPPLPEGKYRVILADPPWQYSNAGLGGAAEKHYATLSLEEICELEDANGRKITDLPADNSVLFLWVTSSFLQEGLEVCKKWGFDYKTNFIWIKDRETYGKLGFYTYSQHEFLFVAVKGSCLPEEGSLVPSIISAPKSKHSRKPDIVYEIIEQMYKFVPTLGTKISDLNKPIHVELFSRNVRRKGWAGWGLEYDE